MYRCDDIEQLGDFAALVVTSAPDHFPKDDFLRPDQQLNLERAFQIMREGFDRVVARAGESASFIVCRAMLEEAYTHYREGRIKNGAWRLQDLMEEIEKIRGLSRGGGQ